MSQRKSSAYLLEWPLPTLFCLYSCLFNETDMLNFDYVCSNAKQMTSRRVYYQIIAK